jgi:hypothetical protein
MRFNNSQEINEKSRKLRTLWYTKDISVDLVNFRDLTQSVAIAGPAFRDQEQAELPDDSLTMMYMLGRIPDND